MKDRKEKVSLRPAVEWEIKAEDMPKAVFDMWKNTMAEELRRPTKGPWIGDIRVGEDGVSGTSTPRTFRRAMTVLKEIKEKFGDASPVDLNVSEEDRAATFKEVVSGKKEPKGPAKVRAAVDWWVSAQSLPEDVFRAWSQKLAAQPQEEGVGSIRLTSEGIGGICATGRYRAAIDLLSEAKAECGDETPLVMAVTNKVMDETFQECVCEDEDESVDKDAIWMVGPKGAVCLEEQNLDDKINLIEVLLGAMQLVCDVTRLTDLMDFADDGLRHVARIQAGHGPA